jgi:HEAT repeat protein
VSERELLRLVPRERDPYFETTEMVRKRGWIERQEPPEAGWTVTWEVPDSTTEVHWLEDPVTRVDHFVIEGDRRHEVARQVRDDVEILEPSDLPALVATADDTQAVRRALCAAAIVAHDRFDPEILALFQRAFADEDDLVRRYALLATTLAGWRELRDPVERVMRTDPDPEVRATAAEVLEILEEGWNEEHGEAG